LNPASSNVQNSRQLIRNQTNTLHAQVQSLQVTKPEDIILAIKRGIQKTQEGIPVLLEFITSKETEVSRPGT
jgi:hypothetical protein